MQSAGFRRNPQEHAGTGAIRQEKTPTENGWDFIIGGGTRNRTNLRPTPENVAAPWIAVLALERLAVFASRRASQEMTGRLDFKERNSW